MLSRRFFLSLLILGLALAACIPGTEVPPTVIPATNTTAPSDTPPPPTVPATATQPPPSATAAERTAFRQDDPVMVSFGFYREPDRGVSHCRTDEED